MPYQPYKPKDAAPWLHAKTKRSTVLKYVVAGVAGLIGIATSAVYLAKKDIQRDNAIEAAQIKCAASIFGPNSKPEMMRKDRFFLNNAQLGLSNVSGSFDLITNEASIAEPNNPNATTVLRMLSPCRSDRLKIG